MGVKARIIEHEERFKSLFEPAELAAVLFALEKFRAFGDSITRIDARARLLNRRGSPPR